MGNNKNEWIRHFYENFKYLEFFIQGEDINDMDENIKKIHLHFVPLSYQNFQFTSPSFENTSIYLHRSLIFF